MMPAREGFSGSLRFTGTFTPSGPFFQRISLLRYLEMGRDTQAKTTARNRGITILMKYFITKNTSDRITAQ